MAANLIEQIKEAGVVGAGGAGFPTHIKLNAQVEYVIVNGAECEPLLRANQQIMEIYANLLWQGLKLVVEHTGADLGIIALKKKYVKAINALDANKIFDEQYKMHILDDFYPAGDEHVLVQEVTTRIVPEGGIPLNVGCVVINIETLLNIWWATQGLPVINKFVTIAGAVRDPVTLRVPIGTPLLQLIELAGGPTVKNYKIIDGGPMMGQIVPAEGVVTKTTGGVIVLPTDHQLIAHKEQSLQISLLRAKSVCCQCQACTDICPRYLLGHNLEPHKIMRLIGSSYLANNSTMAFLCSECGVCDKYGCPMGLSPRLVNKMLKRELAKAKIKNPHQRKKLSENILRAGRKIPSTRLIARLDLAKYNLSAPLIEKEILVEKVTIPLAQHLGKPAVPVVKVGDKIRRGQLIAKIPDPNAVGANIHASISGIVEAVGTFILISGLKGGEL